MNLFKEGAESKVYLTEDNKILKLYKTKCCCKDDNYEYLNLYYELTQLVRKIFDFLTFSFPFRKTLGQ